ncbi:MAG: M23 family metallopeptidase [Richelia sp. SM1_7_0]|nr:M23 family metallopeptidase [Richelia sp. SM1_7_0]
MQFSSKKILSGVTVIAGIIASWFGITNYLGYAQVSGKYTKIKLPYTAGEAYQVTGTHESGRHAIDFAMYLKNVLAIKAGRVDLVAKDQHGGKYILVDHGDGFCAIYLHLNSFNVNRNDSVKQGQAIAVSGNSGLGGKYHLHLAVIKKTDPDGRCTANHSNEVAMIFDEKPNAPLVLNDSIVSQNPKPRATSPQPPQATTFQSPVSKLSVSVASVNLTVQAKNLSRKKVYWGLYRPAVGNLPARYWQGEQVAATSNSLTLRDLDGLGDTLKGVNYYTVASLSPIPKEDVAKMRTSCFAASGGTQLCDRASR